MKYEAMRKADLVKIAEERGLDPGGATKAELVEMLGSADAEASDRVSPDVPAEPEDAADLVGQEVEVVFPNGLTERAKVIAQDGDVLEMRCHRNPNRGRSYGTAYHRSNCSPWVEGSGVVGWRLPG